MAVLKTKETELSVDGYLDAIVDEARRQDCRKLIDLMREATQAEPKMWGTSIVGFGRYHYKYASGHEGDSCLTGFASRKRDLTIYVMSGFKEYESLLADLGKHKTGKACLYVKRLAEINLPVLAQLLRLSVQEVRRRYP